jgi:RNA polymerase sigma-70 factor, ECF subfamily
VPGAQNACPADNVCTAGRPQSEFNVTKPRNESLSKQERSDAARADYATLLRAAQSGSRQAMERLLMRAQEVAYRFSLLVCGREEDAEDTMQEALIKTFRNAHRIRDPEAFRTWLYRTVKNACLISRRRRSHEPAQMLSLDDLMPADHGMHKPIEAVDPSMGPDALAVNASLRRRLRKALQALPSQFRVVVFLREMEGLSTREVAEVIGISEANVKTRLHRARLFLRKELEKP